MTDAIAKKQESALGIPSKDFLKEYSPIAVPAKTAAIRSPVEAAASNMPTLSQIKKHFGEKMTILYLTTWLDNLTAYLGKKYELSEVQTVETANLIFQRYATLNVADLKLVFESIKTGDCGVTLYGDINGLTILKIFDKYFADRAQQCADRNIQRDEVIKKHGYEKNTILSENDVYVGYEELRQRQEREKQKEIDAKNAYCTWLKNRVKAYCEKLRHKT
ncbi:MAG: hypothetical protein IJ933_07735 [Bacteroidales bacterium]|nr:hypothetical protein [Bacteroidales bacterium]